MISSNISKDVPQTSSNSLLKIIKWYVYRVYLGVVNSARAKIIAKWSVQFYKKFKRVSRMEKTRIFL